MKIQRLWVLSATSLLIVGAIGCAVSAQTAVSPTGAQASPQDSAQPKKHHHRIDFAAAATQLGTTEAALKEALGVPAQPAEGDRPEGTRPARPSLEEAATQLGVTKEQLTQALGITIDPQTGQPSRPHTRPDLQAAATQLGVTEEKLKTALGMPEHRTEGANHRGRLDIAGAATKLNVTEEQLIQALGIPARAEGNRPGEQSGQPSEQSGQPSEQPLSQPTGR